MTKDKKLKAHYIPKFLLKNFAIKYDNGNLEFYEKGQQNSCKKGYGAIFYGRELYIESEFDEENKFTGEQNEVVENELAKNEQEASTIIRKIVKMTSGDKEKIKLGYKELACINTFIYLLSIRSLHGQKHLLEHTSAGDELRYSIEGVKKSMGDTPETQKYLDMRNANWCCHVIFNSLKNPNPNICASGISIGYSEENQFIIGDPPFGYLYGDERHKKLKTGTSMRELPKMHRLSNDDIQYQGMWLPVTPNIVLAGGQEPGKTKFFHIPNHFVDKINATLYLNSSQIAASSKKVIESIREYCR